MRKVSGTASSAFRAIWGDLEDQAELSVESGTEHRPNIFKDSFGTPDGKENRKGIHTGKKTSAIVNSPRQFIEEDPTETDLKAIRATLNQSNNFREKLPSALTKKTENSPPTLSPTKIALPIRSKDNSKKSRDIINHDSNSPVQSCKEENNDKHSLGFITGPNKSLKEEARIFHDSNGPDETLCQTSSKIVQNDNEPDGKETVIETNAYKKIVLQGHRTKESRNSNPTNFFDEKKAYDLPKSICGPSPKFPDESITINDNSLNDFVPKENLEFDANEEARTKEASNTSSKIHSSQEEKHDSLAINGLESNVLEDSTKNLANVEFTTIDSSKLLELGIEVTTQNARLKMVHNTPTIENNHEMCKAIINPIDKDMKVECNSSVNHSENGATANNHGILYVPRNTPQLSKDENLIKIQNVNDSNDEILASESVDTLKNNLKSQPEAYKKLSSNFHDHGSIQEENQVTDNFTELCIQDSEEFIENIASNLSGQELDLVGSTDFKVKDINCNTTSDPESQPVITNIKITKNVDETDVVEKQDLEEIGKVENKAAHDAAGDSCESIIPEIKASEDEIPSEAVKDQDTELKDFVTKRTADGIKSDSPRESIITEIKAAEDETRIDAEEDQRPEAKDVLVKDITYDSANDSCESIITVIKAAEDEIPSEAVEDQDTEVKDVVTKQTADDIKSDSPRESIITEIKTVEDEKLSCVIEEQDLKEIKTVKNKTAHDAATSSPRESIITEIKAAEDEIKIDAEEDQRPEVKDVLVKDITYDSANDSCESIISEIKAAEDETRIDAEEDQRPEAKDVLDKDITYDSANDSCESIISEIKAAEDETRIDAEEDQRPEVKDVLVKDITYDSANDSCESIIPEIKAPENDHKIDPEAKDVLAKDPCYESASGSSESIIPEIKAPKNHHKIDPEVKDVLAKDITYDFSSSSCESIIPEIKAAEDETRIDAEEDQRPEAKDVLVKDITYDSANDSCESIISEIKAPENGPKINPEAEDFLARDPCYDSASGSCESIIPEIKAPENDHKIDPEAKDVVTKKTSYDVKSDFPCKPIITEIIAPVGENRSGKKEDQDLKVTDFVAKNIADEKKSDSLCESIITEINALEIETPEHDPQLNAKEDQSLSSTNAHATHEPHGNNKMNRSTLEPITSTIKKEERNFHQTELDEFKRVVNSRFLIRNASEEGPALLSNQGLKSKINNSDMASEKEKSIEKSTDKKIRDKRAKFTSIAAAESRTSILSLGSSRENPCKFEVLNEFSEKFNANDNGSITTTKVKKSLKEKIMGKISGKLHKIKN
ncbi:hypothetical protein Golomagni_04142 [Golovinomyces magnicellulatus]|nr:hypothetical protein Golomagni_04142 [Golovinomyces magnicellulatus]